VQSKNRGGGFWESVFAKKGRSGGTEPGKLEGVKKESANLLSFGKKTFRKLIGKGGLLSLKLKEPIEKKKKARRERISSERKKRSEGGAISRGKHWRG